MEQDMTDFLENEDIETIFLMPTPLGKVSSFIE